jgi:chemotaxis protein histidine kinase CheA
MSSEKKIVYIDQDFKEIVPEFIEAFNQNILEIKDYLKAEDYYALRVIGHNLKGTGGGYGFDEISDIGHKLNMAAKEKDSKSIDELIPDLESYFSRITIIYKEIKY